MEKVIIEDGFIQSIKTQEGKLPCGVDPNDIVGLHMVGRAKCYFVNTGIKNQTPAENEANKRQVSRTLRTIILSMAARGMDISQYIT